MKRTVFFIAKWFQEPSLKILFTPMLF